MARSKKPAPPVTYSAVDGLGGTRLPVAICGGHLLDCEALNNLSLQLGCTMEQAAVYAVTEDPQALEAARFAGAALLYVTFSAFGEHRILYVGSDKNAALDARQSTDDRTVQQVVMIDRRGAEDFVVTVAPLPGR